MRGCIIDIVQLVQVTVCSKLPVIAACCLQGERFHASGVVQAVKAICMTLCNVETIDIVKAIRRLMATSGDMPNGTGSR